MSQNVRYWSAVSVQSAELLILYYRQCISSPLLWRLTREIYLRAPYSPDNFEVHNGEEITLKGFLDLNQMEAKDSDGDPDDLWVTLESMGYNKSLELNQVQLWLCHYYPVSLAN